MTQRVASSTLAAAVAALVLAGCSGSGSSDSTPPPDPPDPPGNGNGDPDPPVTGFAWIQDNVFTPICTACHVGGGAPEGLRLEADVAFGMLVEVSSSQVPELMRVEPGNPDDSYLVQKIEGTAAVGDRMPQGQPPLDSDTIATIRQWIAEGAEPPMTAGFASTVMAASMPAPVTLAAGWPMQDATLDEPPGQIVLIASAALDTTLIHADSVRLLMPDRRDPATLEPQRITDVSLRVSSQAPTRIRLQLPTAAWTPGRYELHAGGTVPIADLSGTAIDGNGDGTPGGDFVLRFEVEPSP